MRRLLFTILTAEGYAVSETASGSDALQATLTSPGVDLLLLDLTLPDMDGLKIIRELRGSGSSLPIIVLSNRSDENAKVVALDLGADDYVTKPFGAAELFARVRAALRHRRQIEGHQLIFRAGALQLDLMRRLVVLDGKLINLSSKEYALLSLLAMNAGKVLTHSFILNSIWRGDAEAQYIRIYIRSLRQKLGDSPENPRFIFTEQGVGYRFCDDITSVGS
jgi:two-component system, OmpR family, KDP operon response regulator KdpE